MMSYAKITRLALLAAIVITFWAGPSLACNGTGQDGCTCIAYSSDYHSMGDEVIADYEMRVDLQDLYNSSNTPLNTIRAVLQQDRANYHSFHRASGFDKGDNYFSTLAHRNMFQSLPLTSYCGTDPADPSVMYDRITEASKEALVQGAMVHVMLYRIGKSLRLHIATIG
jgi:hypothetical protein